MLCSSVINDRTKYIYRKKLLSVANDVKAKKIKISGPD